MRINEIINEAPDYTKRAEKIKTDKDKRAKKAAKIFTGQWIRWLDETFAELSSADRLEDLTITIKEYLRKQIIKLVRLDDKHKAIKKDVNDIITISKSFEKEDRSAKKAELLRLFENLFRKAMDVDKRERWQKRTKTVEVALIKSDAPAELRKGKYLVKMGTNAWGICSQSPTNDRILKLVSKHGYRTNAIVPFIDKKQEYEYRKIDDDVIELLDQVSL